MVAGVRGAYGVDGGDEIKRGDEAKLYRISFFDFWAIVFFNQ
jgi:hypothetical protein